MKIVKALFFLLLSIPAFLQAQSEFNTDNYKQFLSSHQNMNSDELLKMNDAGVFRGDVDLSTSDALFLDSISIKYNLTDFEKSLIQKNGFMVSERLSRLSFGQVFLDIFKKDLPVFVSTDAILHAFHISYDRILMDIELQVLLNKVSSVLSQLHSKIPQLEAKYSGNISMQQMFKDVDVYLTVPRKLLDESAAPYYPSNLNKVNYLYGKAIEANGINTDTLFADACVVVDWSQFKPRGHYVNEQFPELEKYFRAMMWLGRIELYLLPPKSYPEPLCVVQDFEDAKRQTIDSYLISELFDLSNSWKDYNDIEEILQYFIGKPDNVTIDNLLYLKNNLSVQDAGELLDSIKLVTFQDSLKQQSFANQLILSQILFQGAIDNPDSIVPASAFMLFGQRFIIDSYVTGSVVFDRIKYNDQFICRLYPSSLDPMYALGNNAAAQLLIPELDNYHYSSNLASLRYLVDSYDTDFWNSTIYNSWLGAIRKLNPPGDRSALPKFMQTAAFWQEKLNTQLASWTQLRHDNLLYAKQSYTGGATCSYPYSYVEPFPEFYNSLKVYAEGAIAKFQKLPFNNPWLKEAIISYFNKFSTTMDTLEEVSKKILNGTVFNDNEINFLKTIIYEKLEGCVGPPYGGWYPTLLYMDSQYMYKGLMQSDHIVADIHTTPTDCAGNPIGAITHVGTGPVNIGVFVSELPGGEKVAFVGPTLSYYEYVTTNFLRLTDQEWASQYLQSSVRPSWVNTYLADSSGNSRGSGLSLVTSVQRDPLDQTPKTYLTAVNYPNPFNPSTIISFNIPYDLTNSHVKLIVYNVQGEEIAKLVDDQLPSGNYLTKWDGRNDKGISVPSGVYLYNLTAGSRQFSGKMTLIK